MQNFEEQQLNEVMKETPDCSVWVFRHYTADYDPEHLVAEAAEKQSTQSVEYILNEVKSGDTVVLYGAGTQTRHLESYKLLEEKLRIAQIEGVVPFSLYTTSDIARRSLRPGPFLELKEYDPNAQGRAHLAWLEKGEELSGIVETPLESGERLRKIVSSLTNYGLNNNDTDGRVHFILITSAEVMEQGYSIHGKDTSNGGWIRFDSVKGGDSVHAKTISGKEWDIVAKSKF